MNTTIKKILVFLPVFIVSLYFLRVHFDHLDRQVGERRLFALFITVILFYAWVIVGIIRRKQDSFFHGLLQSSYYVYIFGVLIVTGYFILFREVSAHDWWSKMMSRIDHHKGLNLIPFWSINHSGWLSFQVIGNIIMLLPLGIYLPLLYKRITGFFTVTVVCMLVSVSIELMQLVTNFRVTDVDDVILNTSGGAIGYLVYAVFKITAGKPSSGIRQASVMF